MNFSEDTMLNIFWGESLAECLQAEHLDLDLSLYPLCSNMVKSQSWSLVLTSCAGQCGNLFTTPSVYEGC